MAEYSIRLDDDLRVARAHARGTVSKSLGMELVREARAAAAKVGYGILWDVRDATLDVELADFFFLPRELVELQTGPTRSVQVALLVQASEIEDYDFYENVAANVGLRVRAFVAEEEALAWLRSS